MAPPKKRAGTQQPRGGSRRSALTVAPPLDPAIATAARKIKAFPEPAGGLLKASKQAWVTFWQSISAEVAEDVDVLVAERWLLAYDEYHRSLNAFRRRRLVDGSTGQPVLNPLAAWVSSREAAMHKAEVQLGIGMKNRADLAIGVGNARMTAAQLNRMTEVASAGEVQREDEDIVDAELVEEFTEAE